MDSLADLAPIDPVLAELALRYRWPADPAKVALYLKAVSLLHSGSGLSEISSALGVPGRKVSTMLNEAASITRWVTGVREEFRVIPYRQLDAILLMHRDWPARGRRGEAPTSYDFSTVDKIRAFFSVSPLPGVIPNLGRYGEKVVREALGIKLTPVGAYKVSHSATTIKAALAVVERNFSHPLVQTALARWRTLP